MHRKEILVLLKLLAVSVIACLLSFTRAFAKWPTPEVATSRGWVNVNESPLSSALDIHYGTGIYRDYFWTGVPHHTENMKALHLDGEILLPITYGYGKAGAGLGTGILIRRNIPLPNAQVAHILAFPIVAQISYRADFMKDQILVPFLKAGMGSTFFQRIEGGAAGKAVFAYWDYRFGGGVELCLNKIDPKSAHDFDQSIGVNNTYFVFEYLKSKPFGEENAKTDLDHSEYRFGLRFEM